MYMIRHVIGCICDYVIMLCRIAALILLESQSQPPLAPLLPGFEEACDDIRGPHTIRM